MIQFLRLVKAIVITLLLGFTAMSGAHNNVVVIPFFDDNELSNPISPVPNMAPPNADYFIRSNRVEDEITGLVWQRYTEPLSFNWHDAWEYCHTLDLDDLIQWRLPEPYELISIVDYTDRAPSINVSAFPDATISRDYWTNQFSSNFTSPTAAFVHALTVDFNEGLVSREELTVVRYVRCVHGRSASRGGILRDNANGIVSDLSTGLHWQTGRSSGSWIGAQNYCEELELGGKRNWRVPNIKEMASIADYRTPYSVQSVDWFEFVAGVIWTSHENISHTAEAWTFNNQAGTVFSRDKTSIRTVRCVSNG